MTNTTPPKAHCHDGAIRISFTHWGLFITTCWVPLFDFDCVCVIFSYNSFYLREEILIESKQYSSSILCFYWSYLFILCSIYYAPMPEVLFNPSMLIRGFKHIPPTQVYPSQHSAGPLTLLAENSTLMENFVFVKHLPFGGMQAGAGGFGSWILGGACWSSTSTKRYLP